MRAQITFTELTEGEWSHLQRAVRTSYKVPDDAARVCLTFSYGEEERHVEMTVSDAMSLFLGLSLLPVMKQFRLTMGELSRHLENARNEADPARAEARRKPTQSPDEAGLLDEVSEFPSAEGWPDK